MPDTAPMMDYASDSVEQPAEGLLRRIVAWSAILYGGESVGVTLLQVALATRWLDTPANMSWSIEGGWSRLLFTAQALAMAGFLAGGLLLLKRLPASILVLRISAGSLVVVTLGGIAATLVDYPPFASNWSTPGAAVMMALQVLHALWMPALFILLTLPPLARRMVRCVE